MKTGIGITPLWEWGRVLEYVEEQIAILFWQQAMEPKHIGEFIIKQQS